LNRAGALKIPARFDKLWIDPDSGFKFGDRLRHITLPGKDAAQIIVRRAIVRVNLQQFTKKPDRIRQASGVGRRFPHRLENSAQTFAADAIFRI
jgi:hypothetical protein